MASLSRLWWVWRMRHPWMRWVWPLYLKPRGWGRRWRRRGRGGGGGRGRRGGRWGCRGRGRWGGGWGRGGGGRARGGGRAPARVCALYALFFPWFFSGIFVRGGWWGGGWGNPGGGQGLCFNGPIKPPQGGEPALAPPIIVSCPSTRTE